MRLRIRTMREIIREAVSGATRPPADAVIAIAEFVGANEKFDTSIIDWYIPTKQYKNLYRLWLRRPLGTPVETLDRAVSGRRLLSTSLTFRAIAKMLREDGDAPDSHPVTVFDGIGFDPYQVIRTFINENPKHPEVGFMRSVLAMNEWQEEIVVTQVTSPQRLVDPSEIR